MKLLLSFLFILTVLYSKVQAVQDTAGFYQFEQYVQNILEGPSIDMNEYPKPPALTKEVLIGLREELKDDSAKYYFNHLSLKKFKSHLDYAGALKYYKEHRLTYCILSLSVHWNADVRVYSLMALNWIVSLRPQICTTKQWYDKLIRDDKTCLAFLIYVLESTPLFISGSENATIHGIYMSNITWMLDLLTKENITGKNILRDWYKNDLHYETAVLKWKSHLVKK
jgi:hypothetical protein